MKNKILRVALYDPYLNTLGGGEKHILSILEVFAEQGHEINVFWDENLSKEIKNRFSFQFIDKLNWHPNIFKQPSIFSTLKTLRTLKTFDYFFYVTDGSYFFSGAKNNFVFCMIPDKKLYNLNLLNRLKLWNYKFISNSPFTTKWLHKWNIIPITIPPYINNQLLTNKNKKKEKIILSVGRFFPHLHSKNQEKIIETFKLLKKASPLFKEYKLVIVGGLINEDKQYFNQLKSLSKNDLSIVLKSNISREELYEFYELSDYFWHFTGFEVNENLHPEQVEHFGITPLEAMASGCLTFSYNAGGPKEMIMEENNGYLFNSVEELIQKMIAIENNPKLKKEICLKGRIFVENNFSYKIFKEKIFKLI
jgi:glycosyltransferase involved in cell wall biosynthesis